MRQGRPKIHIQFPIVIYQSESDDCGAFTAHCLNMDLIADDDTVEGAVSLLPELIESSIESGAKHRANVFRDAPQKYWDILSRAKKLPNELMERIIFNANKRCTTGSRVNVETQCDLRQFDDYGSSCDLQTA